MTSMVRRTVVPAVAPFAMAAMRHRSRLADEALRELEEEQQEEKTPRPDIPAGWTLKHKAGESCFTLSKQYNDESLEVYCQLQVADPDIAERRRNGDDSSMEHFPFTLLVTRNGKTLDFSLTHVDGEMVIDGLAHFASPAVASDMSAEGMARKERMYQGPTFAELHDKLVDSVAAFLEERGVDDDLSAFVASYSYWMEQQEYENWLRCVADFAS